MGARFASVDRETPMLLPPDLRDWVPEDDLVHFVIEAVERLPLESFRANINNHAQGPKLYFRNVSLTGNLTLAPISVGSSLGREDEFASRPALS